MPTRNKSFKRILFFSLLYISYILTFSYLFILSLKDSLYFFFNLFNLAIIDLFSQSVQYQRTRSLRRHDGHARAYTAVKL